MARVLIADEFAPEGLRLLEQAGSFQVVQTPPLPEPELCEKVAGFEALIVRSSTRVTHNVIEAGSSLKVVARAGIGVDNIDVDAATRRGVIVLNSPEGNVTSAAEHTMALLLSAARHVATADAAVRRRTWPRKDLMGIELSGRTMGIAGLGHVGLEVARLANAFGMRLLGFDPYVSRDVATAHRVELVDKDRLLAESDVVTLHIPLNRETTGFIGRAELRRMRPGAILVNCARGELVDESALAEALRTRALGAAALDVFSREPLGDSPLLEIPSLVLTPHLGGSTQEAQKRISCDIARQIVAYFQHGQILHAVNTIQIKEPHLAPYLGLAERLGSIASQLTKGRVLRLSVACQGKIGGGETRPLTVAALAGVLSHACGASVNRVNAELVARERGVRITESRSVDSPHYVNLVSVTLETDKAVRTVGGTLVDGREERLVHLDGYPIDVAPAREMLIVFHPDRPGMVGRLGTILGERAINIDRMAVSRRVRGQQALTILTVDDPVPAEVLDEIRGTIPAGQADAVRLS